MRSRLGVIIVPIDLLPVEALLDTKQTLLSA